MLLEIDGEVRFSCAATASSCTGFRRRMTEPSSRVWQPREIWTHSLMHTIAFSLINLYIRLGSSEIQIQNASCMLFDMIHIKHVTPEDSESAICMLRMKSKVRKARVRRCQQESKKIEKNDGFLKKMRPSLDVPPLTVQWAGSKKYKKI